MIVWLLLSFAVLERNLVTGTADWVPDRQFRLVNGSNHSEGRVEVYIEGEWGAVCNSSQEGLAEAICSQLGFQSEGTPSSMGIINNEGDVYICEYTEELNCTKITTTECASHLRVTCSAQDEESNPTHTNMENYTTSSAMTSTAATDCNDRTASLGAAIAVLLPVLVATVIGWICTCALLYNKSLKQLQTSSLIIRTRRNKCYSHHQGNFQKNNEATPTQPNYLGPNYDIVRSCYEDSKSQQNQQATNTEQATPTQSSSKADECQDDFHNADSHTYAVVNAAHKKKAKKKRLSEDEMGEPPEVGEDEMGEPPVYEVPLPGETSWGVGDDEYANLQY